MKADSCVYCGFPTRDWSRTCVHHRDLVALDPGRVYNDAVHVAEQTPLEVALPARERDE